LTKEAQKEMETRDDLDGDDEREEFSMPQEVMEIV